MNINADPVNPVPDGADFSHDVPFNAKVNEDIK